MAQQNAAVLSALFGAQKRLADVQTALREYNALAVQIPMYGKLDKMIAELRSMVLEAQKLP